MPIGTVIARVLVVLMFGVFVFIDVALYRQWLLAPSLGVLALVLQAAILVLTVGGVRNLPTAKEAPTDSE